MVRRFIGNKTRTSMAGMLSVLLLFSAWFSVFAVNSASAATIGSGAVGQNITNWVMDEGNGYIYAVTDDTNKLLFIRLDDLQIEKQLSIGAGLSDIRLDSGKLYIALSTSSSVTIVDTATQEVDKTIATGGGRSPFRIAVDGSKLYYVERNNHSFVYCIDMAAPAPAESQIDVYPNNYYMPDLAVDKTNHVLYVAESGNSGSDVVSYSTLTHTKIGASTYDESYGFPYPTRKVIQDGDDVFYAGRKLDKNNLALIRGDYTDGPYQAKIVHVKGSYVLSDEAVYDRDNFVRIAAFPFKTERVLMDGADRLFLFSPATKSIEKVTLNLAPPAKGTYTRYDNKLGLDRAVTKMVYSDETGLLYAISQDTNKLLYMNPSDLTVLDELFIGSKPSDIALQDNKLYVSLWGSTHAAVISAVYTPGTTNTIELLSLDANPYRISVMPGKMYYIGEDQWEKLRSYDLTAACSGGAKPCGKKINDTLYYEPELALNGDNSLLYIGETGISSGNIYAVNTANGTQQAKTAAGLSYPKRALVASGGFVYYGGLKFDAGATGTISPAGQDFGGPVVYADNNYVFTETAVYGQNGAKQFDLPFPIKQALVTGGGQAILYSAAKNGIYTYHSVDEIKVPRAVAQNVSFKDTDPAGGQIQGAVTWTGDADESYITGYNVYFTDENGNKGVKIGEVSKSAAGYSLTVTGTTYIPAGATRISVFSKNVYAESAKFASVPIRDLDASNLLHLDGLTAGSTLQPNQPIVGFTPKTAGGSRLHLHFPDDNMPEPGGNGTVISATYLTADDFALVKTSDNSAVPISVMDATYAPYGAIELQLGTVLDGGSYLLKMSAASAGNEITLPALAGDNLSAHLAVYGQTGDLIHSVAFNNVVLKDKNAPADIAPPALISPLAPIATNLADAKIVMKAKAGVTVNVFEGNMVVGSAKGAGDAEVAISLSGLAEGPHNLTMKAIDAGKTSAPVFVPTLTIDNTAPAAPAGLRAEAGNGAVALSWQANAEQDVAGYLVEAASAAETRSYSVTTSTYFNVAPLTNGTEYSFTVRAVDRAGNKSEPAAPVKATPYGPDSSRSKSGQSAQAPAEAVTETLPDGTAVTRVVVDAAKLMEAFDRLKDSEGQTVTVQIGGNEAKAVVEIPASALFGAGQTAPDAVLVMQSSAASYHLPVKLLDLAVLAQRLGADLKEITVRVTMEKVTGATAESIRNQTDRQGLKLLTGAVEFSVAVQAGDKREDIADFGAAYVTRVIVLPGTVDASRATAVLYDAETGEFPFVPAMFTTADGVTQAVLKRNGNSIYAVVESSKTFSDIGRSWAKEDIELLASKLVINGVSDTAFSPDSSITRAQFAALLVRSLGISQPGGDGKFLDVAPADWFAPAVSKAAAAGIVAGYEDGSFRPGQTISRQEMAVMIVRAMKYAGHAAVLSDEEQASQLLRFDDKDELGEWARGSAAAAVKEGIIGGVADREFSAGSEATRAQSASIVYRMMKVLKFIN